MRRLIAASTVFLAVTPVFLDETPAHEWSGSVAVEGRLFPSDPLFPEQRSQGVSLSTQPEYYHEWAGGSSITAVPFVRLDSADDERTHIDLREFFFLWVPEAFEVGIGIRKVFWGVTESQHLVDIINQTDVVEYPDGEDKLGQPMLNVSVLREWGTLDLFVLPYFRERTFPGPRGRLRTSVVVETGQARFESGAKAHHVDMAVRYSHTLGDWDIGVSHFRGTGREPTLLLDTSPSGDLVLVPFYEQIAQTGLDLQWVVEVWLWKLEIIHRTGQADDLFAWTGGFEYTVTGIAGSRMDLGVIGEWLYDDRGDGTTTPFENDLMSGLRLAVNDVASTELLVGVIQDLDSAARMFSVQGSRRLSDHWKLDVEILLFTEQDPDELLFGLRDDDVVQLTLAYHF